VFNETSKEHSKTSLPARTCMMKLHFPLESTKFYVLQFQPQTKRTRTNATACPITPSQRPWRGAEKEENQHYNLSHRSKPPLTRGGSSTQHR